MKYISYVFLMLYYMSINQASAIQEDPKEPPLGSPLDVEIRYYIDHVVKFKKGPFFVTGCTMGDDQNYLKPESAFLLMFDGNNGQIVQLHDGNIQYSSATFHADRPEGEQWSLVYNGGGSIRAAVIRDVQENLVKRDFTMMTKLDAKYLIEFAGQSKCEFAFENAIEYAKVQFGKNK